MSEQEIDQVDQLRRLGIGLVLGGIAFGALSFVGATSAAGAGLIVAGLVAWGIEYRQDLTVGIGLGIGVAGVVILVETASATGFSDGTLAVALVGFGVADYLLAPVYGELQDAGRRSRRS